MTAAVLLLAALAVAAAPAPASEPPSTAPAVPARASTIPGAELEFKSVDGWTLHAVWRKAQEGKSTLVLLAGTGQRKEEWRPFARALAKAGYGYAALDMRGHGESRTTPSGELITYKKLRAVKGANDYEDMTRDVEALVGVLVGQGAVEESVGILGAEVGGSVAVKYAAVHLKVPFVIMLSPDMHTQDIPIVNALRAFRGRTTPILMVHSEADPRSSKDTPVLFSVAKISVGENNASLIVEPDERGTRMLRKNKDLTGRVLAWIADPHPPAVAVSTDAASGVAADTAAATSRPDQDSEAEPEAPVSDPAPAPGGDSL